MIGVLILIVQDEVGNVPGLVCVVGAFIALVLGLAAFVASMVALGAWTTRKPLSGAAPRG